MADTMKRPKKIGLRDPGEMPIFKIPHWQFLVCTSNEFEIEKSTKNAGTIKALDWIDEKIKQGTYEIEREKLTDKWSSTLNNQQIWHQESVGFIVAKRGREYIEARIELGQHQTRFFQARNSSDISEQKKFEAVSKAILEILEIGGGAMLLPILRLVRSPKKSKGRNERWYPTEADHKLLSEMRQLIFLGSTSSAAAKKVSQTNPGIRALSTQKRLEKWWRWKMELRTHGGI